MVMEAETQFVYSQTDRLLQNIWQFKPLRPLSTFSSQIRSDSINRFSVKNQRAPSDLKNHELLAINGHIDSEIAPGFRYRVREIETQKDLFNGQAKYLESIGQGYGKRLTFESDDILENDNFFWTDSNEFGYAFSLQAVSIGDVFVAKTGNIELGFAKVVQVRDSQRIVSSEIQAGAVMKKVEVEFHCKMAETWDGKDFNGKFSLRLQGVATLVKGKRDQRCQIQDIRILNGSGSSVVLQPVL